MKFKVVRVRSVPGWARFLIRIAVWGAVVVTCLLGFCAYHIVSHQDWAYDGIHDHDSWVPRARFTREAKLYTESYLRHRHFYLTGEARLEHPSAKHLVPILFKETLDDEVVLEIAASRSLKDTLPPGPISLETYLSHSYGRCEEKERALYRLLRKDHISPSRFRELRSFLAETVPTKEAGQAR